MNKNLLKIGALALGMFTFGLVLMGTSNAETGDVTLTINTGTSECTYGTSLNLGSQVTDTDLALTFSGYFNVAGTQTPFVCTDRAGGNDRNWSFTIQSTDLNGTNGGSISSGNVSIKHDTGIVTGSTACIAGTSTADFNSTLNNVYTIMSRSAASSLLDPGVCQLTVNNVRLKVEVVENQAPGTYVGDLTFTINTL